MNIALGAIIIVILILPGVSFRAALISSDSLENTLDTSLSGEIILSLISAIIWQLAGVSILYFFSCQVDVYVIVLLISDPGSDLISSELINSKWWQFLGYTLIISFLGYIAGFFCRKLILQKNWHLSFGLLHITNEWDDLFQGRGQVSEVDYVNIDILLDTYDGTYIYSGALSNYYMSKGNKLDKLILSNTYRRKLQDDRRESEERSANLGQKRTEVDKEKEDRWYRLPGEHFVVDGSKISNIHIRYMLDPEQENTASSSMPDHQN